MGTPPEDPNAPVIDENPDQPDTKPDPEPQPDPDFIIIAADTEEEIENKIQEYYKKHEKYAAFVEGSETDIKQNNTLTKINAVITRNAYPEGILLDLSGTTITEIADNSFYENKHLYSVKLPETLISIGNNAFRSSEKLIEINFPASLTKIGEGAFLSCKSLEEVNLKDTKITILSNYVFSDCANLTKVVLPDVLLGMENSAFSFCTSLEEISLPKDFLVIGNSVFYGCINLKKVNFNDKIKSIYHYAFYGCTSISKISLPGSLTKLGATGADVFPGCTSLLDVEYLGQVPNAIIYLGNVFGTSNPQNLYLPNVEEPVDPTIKEKWNEFLGYDWTGKIKYNTSMPQN